MKKLGLIGIGGHGDAITPYIDHSKYELVGYFDDREIDFHNGLPVLGKIKDALALLNSGEIERIFIAIGDNSLRSRVYDMIAPKHYDKFINIIADDATILSPELIKGKGIFIGHDAFVGSKVTLMDNVIVNTKSIIEHNTYVDKHCNIAPAAVVLGSVLLQEKVYVGASTTIKQLVNVQKGATIGAGAVVVSDIKDSGTYVGIPAKKIKKKD